MMGKIRFNNSALLLLVAVVCGALAFFGARRYLVESTASVRQSWEERYKPVAVLVAARDLPAGRSLQSADLARRAVPSAYVPRGVLRPEDIARATGKPLLVPLGAGEPLVATQLLQHADPTLAARLRGGARAVTVPVDEVSSQAGLVRPGDHIDLMLAEERTQGNGRCVLVRPLLETVKVLATGQRQNDPSRSAEAALRRGADETIDYSTITLDVTPEQAQQLAIALRIGELIPMLRGESDVHPTRLAARGSGSSACTADSATSTTRPPRVRGHSIEVVVGGDAAPGKTRHWFPGG
jgi:pilus assembly protein CpaB